MFTKAAAFLKEAVPQLSPTADNAKTLLTTVASLTQILQAVFGHEFVPRSEKQLSAQLIALFNQIKTEDEREFAVDCAEDLAAGDDEACMDVLELLLDVWKQKPKPALKIDVEPPKPDEIVKQPEAVVKQKLPETVKAQPAQKQDVQKPPTTPKAKEPEKPIAKAAETKLKSTQKAEPEVKPKAEPEPVKEVKPKLEVAKQTESKTKLEPQKPLEQQKTVLQHDTKVLEAQKTVAQQAKPDPKAAKPNIKSDDKKAQPSQPQPSTTTTSIVQEQPPQKMLELDENEVAALNVRLQMEQEKNELLQIENVKLKLEAPLVTQLQQTIKQNEATIVKLNKELTTVKAKPVESTSDMMLKMAAQQKLMDKVTQELTKVTKEKQTLELENKAMADKLSNNTENQKYTQLMVYEALVKAECTKRGVKPEQFEQVFATQTDNADFCGALMKEIKEFAAKHAELQAKYQTLELKSSALLHQVNILSDEKAVIEQKHQQRISECSRQPKSVEQQSDEKVDPTQHKRLLDQIEQLETKLRAAELDLKATKLVKQQNLTDDIRKQLDKHVMDTVKRTREQQEFAKTVAKTAAQVNQSIKQTARSFFINIDFIIDEKSLEVDEKQLGLFSKMMRKVLDELNSKLVDMEQITKQLMAENQHASDQARSFKAIAEETTKITQLEKTGGSDAHEELIAQAHQVPKLKVELQLINDRLAQETLKNEGLQQQLAAMQQRLKIIAPNDQAALTVFLDSITDKIDVPLYRDLRMTGCEIVDAKNVSEILTEIQQQLRKRAMKDQRDRLVRDLKLLCFNLQEKLLSEIFMRIKAQYQLTNSAELGISFDEVQILSRMEKIPVERYADFVQLLIKLMIDGQFNAKYAEKLAKMKGWKWQDQVKIVEEEW